MTETPLRAAGYIRVSTVSQAEEGESLKTQKQQIEDFCKPRGWELIKPLYEDAGVSGAKIKRPGLDALFEDAEQQKFQVVICADLTRFGRSAADLLSSIKRLKGLGISFHSIKGNVSGDDGPFGQLLLTVLAATAEFEREMIMIRTKENKMARWSKKEIYNGKAPYGYRWNKQTKKMEKHPDEAPIFERIVRDYLDLGKSLKQVCIDLNNDAVKTRIKGKWISATVSTMLRSTAYCGTMTVNKHILDEEGNIKGDKPPEEHITFEFPEFMSRSRWDALQARLDSGRVERSGRPSSTQKDFLLHGLLRCGHCGGRISPYYQNSRYRLDGTRTRLYACYWHTTGVKSRLEQKREKCALRPIPADHIEFYFWSSFIHLLFRTTEENYDEIFNVEQWEVKEEAARKKIKDLKTDLRKAENVLRNLKGLLELDNVDLQGYAVERAEADQKIRELNQRIGEANNQLKEIQSLREEKESFLKFGKDQKKLLKHVKEIVNNLPMEKKQRLLAGMLIGGTIQIGPIEEGELIMEDAPIEQWDDETAPTYKPTWFDRKYYSWRPNMEILKEILGPYLSGGGNDGGDNGSGNGGGEKGTGNSCKSCESPSFSCQVWTPRSRIIPSLYCRRTR